MSAHKVYTLQVHPAFDRYLIEIGDKQYRATVYPLSALCYVESVSSRRAVGNESFKRKIRQMIDEHRATTHPGADQ